MTDDEFIAALIDGADSDPEDARVLVDRAISELLTGKVHPRLATWLAGRLQLVLDGSDASKALGTSRSRGAPGGLYGDLRVTSEQLAALTVIARRNWPTYDDADNAVAQVVGLRDTSGIRKHMAKYNYSPGSGAPTTRPIEDMPDDDLLAMVSNRENGAALLKKLFQVVGKK